MNKAKPSDIIHSHQPVVPGKICEALNENLCENGSMLNRTLETITGEKVTSRSEKIGQELDAWMCITFSANY